MAPPPDALPVAAAALSNRVSMLFAAQSSVLQTLSPSSSSRPPRATHHHQTQADLDDEALFKGGYHPGGGVGYVPPATDASTTKEDSELRGRILGRRGQQIERERREGRMKKKKKAEDSEEDEDVGRSALGKRKRPRREVRDEQAAEGDGNEEVTRRDSRGDGDEVVEAETQPAVEESTQTATTTTATKRKKNKKKKNKPKANPTQTPS